MCILLWTKNSQEYLMQYTQKLKFEFKIINKTKMISCQLIDHLIVFDSFVWPLYLPLNYQRVWLKSIRYKVSDTNYSMHEYRSFENNLIYAARKQNKTIISWSHMKMIFFFIENDKIKKHSTLIVMYELHPKPPWYDTILKLNYIQQVSFHIIPRRLGWARDLFDTNPMAKVCPLPNNHLNSYIDGFYIIIIIIYSLTEVFNWLLHCHVIKWRAKVTTFML